MNSFPQRCRYFFYFLFLLSITDKVVAQSEKEHTDLLVSIATAEDKPARAVRLAEMTEKVYTRSNMMYFSSMYQAALHSVEIDPRRAVTYIDKAINAFLAHTGAYAQMDANSLVEGYKVLCAAYNAVGLTSTAIQRLDAVRNHVQTLSKAAKCNYYNLLGEQYLILSRFDKAAEAFREQKQLMDNGAPMVTSAKSDPKWKRDFNAYGSNLSGHGEILL